MDVGGHGGEVDASGESLDDPGDDELGVVLGEPAREARNGEESETTEEDPLVSDQNASSVKTKAPAKHAKTLFSPGAGCFWRPNDNDMPHRVSHVDRVSRAWTGTSTFTLRRRIDHALGSRPDLGCRPDGPGPGGR